jgi:hypothetical protein
VTSAPAPTRTVSGRKVVGTFLAILALCLVAYGFERWRVFSERDAARAREAARRARTTTVDAR